MTSSNPSSWEEILHIYEKERIAIPTGVDRNKEVMREMKRRENSFNCITGVYKNKDTEIKTRENEIVKKLQLQDRKARNVPSNSFNIITNASKIGENNTIMESTTDAVAGSHRQLLRKDRPYNPITNEVIPSKEEILKTKEYIADGGVTSYKPRNTTLAREYSIVSGKHFDDHDNKQRAEDDQTLHHAAAIISKTKQYDPILAELVDESQEAAEREKIARRVSVRQQRKADSIPPSIRNRPEQAIDVATNAVVDEQLFMAQEVAKQEQHNARLNRDRGKYSFEQRTRAIGMVKDEEREQQKVNRVNYDHFRIEHERGFNIITNVPTEGLHSQPFFPPHVKAKSSPFVKEQAITSVASVSNE